MVDSVGKVLTPVAYTLGAIVLPQIVASCGSSQSLIPRDSHQVEINANQRSANTVQSIHNVLASSNRLGDANSQREVQIGLQDKNYLLNMYGPSTDWLFQIDNPNVNYLLTDMAANKQGRVFSHTVVPGFDGLQRLFNIYEFARERNKKNSRKGMSQETFVSKRNNLYELALQYADSTHNSSLVSVTDSSSADSSSVTDSSSALVRTGAPVHWTPNVHRDDPFWSPDSASLARFNDDVKDGVISPESLRSLKPGIYAVLTSGFKSNQHGERVGSALNTTIRFLEIMDYSNFDHPDSDVVPTMVTTPSDGVNPERLIDNVSSVSSRGSSNNPSNINDLVSQPIGFNVGLNGIYQNLSFENLVPKKKDYLGGSVEVGYSLPLGNWSVSPSVAAGFVPVSSKHGRTVVEENRRTTATLSENLESADAKILQGMIDAKYHLTDVLAIGAHMGYNQIFQTEDRFVSESVARNDTGELRHPAVVNEFVKKSKDGSMFYGPNVSLNLPGNLSLDASASYNNRGFDNAKVGLKYHLKKSSGGRRR